MFSEIYLSAVGCLNEMHVREESQMAQMQLALKKDAQNGLIINKPILIFDGSMD